jgi:hypothetical protein
MCVSETAMKNIWQHHFLQPRILSEVGEIGAQRWPHAVGIEARMEFFKNYRSHSEMFSCFPKITGEECDKQKGLR